jgi:hypothetical protein
MDRPLAGLAGRFAFNDGLLGMLGDGMSDADWDFSPPGGGNTARWIVGHVACYRRELRRVGGEDLPEADWEAGLKGGDAKPDPAVLPSGAALLAEALDGGKVIVGQLSAATPERAAAPYGATFADGSSDYAGGAHFLFFHETYHLGQVGILRRMRGKAPFA